MSVLPYSAKGERIGESGGAVIAGPGAMTPTAATPQAMVLFDAVEMVVGVTKNVGVDLVTSEKQSRPGMLRDIYIPVTAGVPVTVYIDCLYEPDADPRPRILLRANPDVGLLADVEAVALPGPGWNALSVSCTPTADGVLNLWREFRSLAAGAYALWSNLRMVE